MGLEAKNDTILALTHKNVAQKLNALSTKTLPHDYIAAATGHNTHRVYQSDIRHFIESGFTLLASFEDVLRYLQAHATTLNPRH